MRQLHSPQSYNSCSHPARKKISLHETIIRQCTRFQHFSAVLPRTAHEARDFNSAAGGKITWVWTARLYMCIAMWWHWMQRAVLLDRARAQLSGPESGLVWATRHACCNVAFTSSTCMASKVSGEHATVAVVDWPTGPSCFMEPASFHSFLRWTRGKVSMIIWGAWFLVYLSIFLQVSLRFYGLEGCQH
jgi:hypothetical protein